MAEEISADVGSKEIVLTGNTDTPRWIIQPVEVCEREALQGEAEEIKRILGHGDWCIAAVPVSDWNRELSPWSAPPVFGKEVFGDGAEGLLSYILEELIPYLDKTYSVCSHDYILCGYSLAGLFALWSSYRTDSFSGIAAVSPSVWFPGWREYVSQKKPLSGPIYLSLGDKEEKARNPIMAAVGDAIRAQYQDLQTAEIPSILEWNPGNHFRDWELRTAKGIAWLLNR